MGQDEVISDLLLYACSARRRKLRRQSHTISKDAQKPTQVGETNVMPEQMQALVLVKTAGDEWKPGPKTWHPIEVKDVPVPTPNEGTPLTEPGLWPPRVQSSRLQGLA